nr:MAG TPA: ATP synthase [Caudoviricetes sp.]
MVDYGTMLLIGISLCIVFFGLRYYYESKIRHILEVKEKSDEVVGRLSVSISS